MTDFFFPIVQRYSKTIPFTRRKIDVHDNFPSNKTSTDAYTQM